MVNTYHLRPAACTPRLVVGQGKPFGGQENKRVWWLPRRSVRNLKNRGEEHAIWEVVIGYFVLKGDAKDEEPLSPWRGKASHLEAVTTPKRGQLRNCLTIQSSKSRGER